MADNTDQTIDTSADEMDTSIDAETALEELDETISWEDGDDDGADEADGQTEQPADSNNDGEAEEAEATDEPEEAEAPAEEDTAAVTEEDTAPVDAKKGEPDPDKAREAFLRRKIQREEREKQEKVTLERYLKEAVDDETEFAARQLQVEAYNLNKERAALNEEKLTASIARAKAEIPLLRNMTPEIQEAFGDALDEFQATNVVMNEYGDIVQIKGDVYQHLQRKADSIAKLTGLGVRKAATQKANQKARTVPVPSRAPKAPPVDPDLAAFDEEAYKDWS